MKEVKNSDTGKRLGDEVREYRACGRCIHWLNPGDQVVKLREGVYSDKSLGDVETFGVPEDHPCCEQCQIFHVPLFLADE